MSSKSTKPANAAAKPVEHKAEAKPAVQYRDIRTGEIVDAAYYGEHPYRTEIVGAE